MASAVVAPITFADYLVFELQSPLRHEFVAGHIYAMSGGSATHNEIALNIAARLKSRAALLPCRVFMSDMKLHVRETDSAYYPDVMVSCDKAVRGTSVVVSDALLIVEVSSASTFTVDRREKRAAYQKLPSLQAYWIVSQDERQAEVYLRGPDARWSSITLVAGDAELPMPGLPGPALRLAELYEGTDLAA